MIKVLFWPKLVPIPMVGATKQPRTLLRVSFHAGLSPTKILDSNGWEVFTCS